MPYSSPEKRRVGRRNSYLARKEKILSQERGYRITNPESKRQIQYKRRYGITLDQFEQMVAIQSGRCAICREEFRPTKVKRPVHVDHCHKTMKVRGILCSKCNVALGLFGDDPERLRDAIRYLEQTLCPLNSVLSG